MPYEIHGIVPLRRTLWFSGGENSAGVSPEEVVRVRKTGQ
jgi:hypothetical protein